MTPTLGKQRGWNNTVDLFCLICKGGVTEVKNKHDLLVPGWEKQAQRHPEEKDSSWWVCGLPTAWLGPPATATLTWRGILGGLSEEWVTRSGCPASAGVVEMSPCMAIPATFSCPVQLTRLESCACWWCSVHSANHLEKLSSPLVLLRQGTATNEFGKKLLLKSGGF